jgi:TRAP-type mannitol/chloroaromatic compound transport system substrate-binding protein
LAGSLSVVACAPAEVTVTKTTTETVGAVTVTETVTAEVAAVTVTVTETAVAPPVTATVTETETKTIKETATVTVTGVVEPITWVVGTPWPAGTELMFAAELWSEMVTKASGGRLVLDAYPGGAVVGALETFDAAHAGTIDVSQSWSGYWIGKSPAGPLFGAMPMGFTQPEYVAWLEWGGGLELWWELWGYPKYDFGYIGYCFVIPPEDFMWSRVPVTKLEDFSGLKIRTVGFWGEILSRYLGASVVTLAGAEVYPAMERGTIDAGEYSLPCIDIVLGFHEIMRYVIVPGIHQPSSVGEVLINKDSWDALPDDLKHIVDYCAKAACHLQMAHSKVEDAKALKFFEELPDDQLQVIVASPEMMDQIREYANMIYDEEAAKDPLFAKVLASQREFKELYDYWKRNMMPPGL